MTPDKIFIDEDLIAFHVLQTKHDGDVEYIRKDVLLEWAEAYKEEADASARGRTDNPSWGESVAMRALIDKIESL